MNKPMNTDTDFIFDAVSRIRELSGINIEFLSSSPNDILLVRIEKDEYRVIAKSSVRNSNSGLVISQIEQLRQNSYQPNLLVSEYVAKNVANEFKKRGINFLDCAGNAFIKNGNLFISIDGQKAVRKEKTNQSRAFQEAGLKIIFTILASPQSLQLPYRKLAEIADVSIGSLSYVMSELEVLNYLLKANNRKVLKNHEHLLERWVTAYNEVLRPRMFRKRMKFIQIEHDNAWKSLTNLKLTHPVLWGGEPGAVLSGANLRPEKFILYSNNALSEIAKAFKMVPDLKGEIEILQKFWTFDESEKRSVPPLLVYSDLMLSGSGRNAEIANHILQNEVHNIKQSA
jgi:hypothetical protein